MKRETECVRSDQFGIRHLLLVVVASIAIVLALRICSVRNEDYRWVSYAPVVGAALITGGYWIFGTRNWRAIFAGTFFAFLASVAHSLELINRSQSFAFLRRGKVDLSSDPYVNAIVIALTTFEALLVGIVIAIVAWACNKYLQNAG